MSTTTPALPEVQELREAIARAMATLQSVANGILGTSAPACAATSAKELQRALDEELRQRDLAPEPPDNDTEVLRAEMGNGHAWIAYRQPEGWDGRPLAPVIDYVYHEGRWESDVTWCFASRQVEQWEAAALAHVRTCTREAA